MSHWHYIAIAYFAALFAVLYDWFAPAWALHRLRLQLRAQQRRISATKKGVSERADPDPESPRESL